MEEFEILKKLFTEKENENRKLREELTEFKASKFNLTNQSFSKTNNPDSFRSISNNHNKNNFSENFFNTTNEKNNSSFANKYYNNDCNKEEFIFSPSTKQYDSNPLTNSNNNTLTQNKLMNIIDNDRYSVKSIDHPTKHVDTKEVTKSLNRTKIIPLLLMKKVMNTRERKSLTNLLFLTIIN